VYKAIKKEARTLLSLEPYINIIKNMGIKVLSKKIKKPKRSKTKKVLLTPHCKKKRYINISILFMLLLYAKIKHKKVNKLFKMMKKIFKVSMPNSTFNSVRGLR